MLPKYEVFYENILEHFHKNKEQILLFIKEKQNTFPLPILLKTRIIQAARNKNLSRLDIWFFFMII